MTETKRIAISEDSINVGQKVAILLEPEQKGFAKYVKIVKVFCKTIREDSVTFQGSCAIDRDSRSYFFQSPDVFSADGNFVAYSAIPKDKVNHNNSTFSPKDYLMCAAFPRHLNPSEFLIIELNFKNFQLED